MKNAKKAWPGFPEDVSNVPFDDVDPALLKKYETKIKSWEGKERILTAGIKNQAFRNLEINEE